MWFEQFATTAQACIGGMGVGLMPAFLIHSELEPGKLDLPGFYGERLAHFLCLSLEGDRALEAER